MLRVVELFSGIGAQTQALKNIGVEHEVVAIAEIDEPAIASYTALHGEPKLNLGDITKLNPKEVPDHDLLTYSFPCFVAGTKVLTENGYVDIESIKKGDLVMTHKKRFREVVKPMVNYSDHLIKVSTMTSDDLFTTEEHPFYVREMYREAFGKGVNRRMKRCFTEPKWVEAKDLKRGNYIGTPVNTKSEIPEWNGIVSTWSDGRKDRHSNILSEKFLMPEFWWVVGRYIGDGWLRSQGGAIICCALDELEEITPFLDDIGLGYSTVIEGSIHKIHIPIIEFGEYLSQFGRGASNKHLTKDILNLPPDLLEYFLEGYISADGSKQGNIYKVSSVSNTLIYDIGQCVAKVYGRPFSVYKHERPEKAVIEGRVINQRPAFALHFKKDIGIQDQAFYENGYIWSPIRAVEREDVLESERIPVYNMEVEEDNSYVVQNIIVHNCTDISICGAQEGLDEGSGTSSSTLWYCQDIIQEKLPKYLLMENVKNLIGRTHVDNFHKWLNVLSSLGYTSYYSILNAKDFNVPQNRERVFVVSIREEREEKYIFPEPVKLEKNMYDILIDELPEGNFVMEHLLDKRPHYEESFEEGTLNYVGMIDMRGNESIRRVYHPSGICPTLTTMDGGHRQPKFLLDDGRVRKLTPQECWRLMGFSDEQYEKIDFQSNRQKYRQAGNSIVVPVLEGIFTNLFKPNKD